MGLLDSIKKYKDKHLIKNEALDSFLIEGFPTTKNEEWKYTSLKKIIDCLLYTSPSPRDS